MSRMTKDKELELISNNSEIFETILGSLEKIDEKRLEALVSLRKKLRFNSDNPKLVVKTSRQVAIGTKLDISVDFKEKQDRLCRS